MANEYASLAELKTALEMSGETFADADLSLALTAASRGIDSACDRRFWLDADANQVRYYTPVNDCLTWIDDLVTLTALAADRGGDGTFSESWTVNTDFVLEPLNAAADSEPFTKLRVHPRGSKRLPCEYPRSVRVTGRFGWSAVPSQVKEATVILASKLMRRAREAPFGVAGVGVEGAAMRIATMDPDVKFLIADFRRME